MHSSISPLRYYLLFRFVATLVLTMRSLIRIVPFRHQRMDDTLSMPNGDAIHGLMSASMVALTLSLPGMVPSQILQHQHLLPPLILQRALRIVLQMVLQLLPHRVQRVSRILVVVGTEIVNSLTMPGVIANAIDVLGLVTVCFIRRLVWVQTHVVPLQWPLQPPLQLRQKVAAPGVVGLPVPRGQPLRMIRYVYHVIILWDPKQTEYESICS